MGGGGLSTLSSAMSSWETAKIHPVLRRVEENAGLVVSLAAFLADTRTRVASVCWPRRLGMALCWTSSTAARRKAVTNLRVDKSLHWGHPLDGSYRIVNKAAASTCSSVGSTLSNVYAGSGCAGCEGAGTSALPSSRTRPATPENCCWRTRLIMFRIRCVRFSLNIFCDSACCSVR